ncbi:hypothetical protein [Streptobacillus moniliformis]|nr:hypothetical protein [Streptobacillus moniliformis]
MINAEQDTIYNNVERLLYKYNHYKARIKSLEKKIEDLMDG